MTASARRRAVNRSVTAQPPTAAAAASGPKAALHVSVTPARRLDDDNVRAYAELGVDRLIVAPPVSLSLEELVEFVEANAPAQVGGASWPGG